MRVIEPKFRNDFEKLERHLKEVVEEETKKRDQWSYENLKITLTLYPNHSKRSKTFSYPFSQNTYKVKAVWASNPIHFSINLFWYQFCKKQDGIEYFEYRCHRHQRALQKPSFFKELEDEVEAIPQTTEEARKRTKQLLQTGGITETQFIHKKKLPVHPELPPEEIEVRRLLSINLSESQPSYKGMWIFTGDHRDGCNGPVDPALARSTLDSLNKTKCEGINFNNDYLVSDLEYGTCSAMSIEFARHILSHKILMSDDLERGFSIDVLKTFECHYKASSIEKRSIQAAMNTIEVDPTIENIDLAKNKVQSLLNLRKIAIDFSSKEFDLKKINSHKKFNRVMNSFPPGIYFIRIIEPSDSHCLEEKGHSLVYIAEQGRKILYDPNYGLFEFARTVSDSALFDTFRAISSEWNIHLMRFYRIYLTDGALYTQTAKQVYSDAIGIQCFLLQRMNNQLK